MIYEIYSWLSQKSTQIDIKLRYGENPDQNAKLRKQGKVLLTIKYKEKEISYNNILDIDSGLDFLNEFTEPTTAIIKHNNACGIASSRTIKTHLLKLLIAIREVHLEELF